MTLFTRTLAAVALGLSALAINPHIYAKVGYDSLKDFDPVVLVAFSPLVIEAVRSREVVEGLRNNSLESLVGTPADFARRLRADHARYGTLVRQIGLKVE